MTRVYVDNDNYVLRIPEAWDRWTFRGYAFRRDGERIEQWVGGKWRLADTERTAA